MQASRPAARRSSRPGDRRGETSGNRRTLSKVEEPPDRAIVHLSEDIGGSSDSYGQQGARRRAKGFDGHRLRFGPPARPLPRHGGASGEATGNLKPRFPLRRLAFPPSIHWSEWKRCSPESASSILHVPTRIGTQTPTSSLRAAEGRLWRGVTT